MPRFVLPLQPASFDVRHTQIDYRHSQPTEESAMGIYYRLIKQNTMLPVLGEGVGGSGSERVGGKGGRQVEWERWEMERRACGYIQMRTTGCTRVKLLWFMFQ